MVRARPRRARLHRGDRNEPRELPRRAPQGDRRRCRPHDRSHPGRGGGRGGRRDHGLGQAPGDHLHRSRLVPGADRHPRVADGSGSERTSRTTPTTGERPIHARPARSPKAPQRRRGRKPTESARARVTGRILYLIRHGQSDFEWVGDRWASARGEQWDPPLSESGREQASAPREAAPRDGPRPVRRVLVPAPARERDRRGLRARGGHHGLLRRRARGSAHRRMGGQAVRGDHRVGSRGDAAHPASAGDLASRAGCRRRGSVPGSRPRRRRGGSCGSTPTRTCWCSPMEA